MYNQRLDETQEYDWFQELAPQIVETVGTGVAPDMSEDLELFASLEARIDELAALREALLQQKGMSQQFALEAQRLLPEFDGKRPIGFYTQEPSATRYAIAVEELSDGVWALIAAGIAAVIYAIVKFFKWISGGKEEANAGTVKDRAAQMKEVQELLKKCDTLVKEGSHSIQGQYVYLKGAEKKELFSLDTVIERLFESGAHNKRMLAFLKTKDPFFHDLVNRGPYSQQMAEFGRLFKEIQIVLRQRLKVLESVNHLDMNEESATSRMANMRALAELKDQTSINFGGHSQTLQEIKHHLTQLAHEAASAEVDGKLSFDQLFHSMTEAFQRSEMTQALEELAVTMPLLEQLKEELQRLEQKAGGYASDGKKDGHSTRIGTELRHAIFVLGQDVAGLTGITSELMSYQSRLFYLADNAANFATVVAEKLAERGMNGNGGELTTWKGVSIDLDRINEKLHSIAKS
jgi:hypothetical protein